jgi:hypothetical protein
LTPNTKDILIKPVGFTINNSHIHNITTEHATLNGVDIAYALDTFSKVVIDCDYIVGYSIYFDVYILLSEFHKLNMKIPIDTMNKMKNDKRILCIGELARQYKKYFGYMPKQTTIYEELFNKPLVNAHNAVTDINATIELARYFYKNKNNFNSTLKLELEPELEPEPEPFLLNGVPCAKVDNKYYKLVNGKKAELFALANAEGRVFLCKSPVVKKFPIVKTDNLENLNNFDELEKEFSDVQK